MEYIVVVDKIQLYMPLGLCLLRSALTLGTSGSGLGCAPPGFGFNSSLDWLCIPEFANTTNSNWDELLVPVEG